MTQLNELINKHIDSIRFNGCQLSKEMLTLMFDGVVALAKIQESFEINQRYLESIGTAFGNGGNDLPKAIGETPKHLQYPFVVGGGGGGGADMSTAKTDGGTGGTIQFNTIDPHKGFIVGEVYKHKTSELAYYCGLCSWGLAVFELINHEGGTVFGMPAWVSKGNNTYWNYEDLEKEFDPTSIVMPNTIGQHITEPEFIQPNEMVKGKWYFIKTKPYNWLTKVDNLTNDRIIVSQTAELSMSLCLEKIDTTSGFFLFKDILQIRPATIEEVTKYFPNEFDSNVTEHPNVN